MKKRTFFFALISLLLAMFLTGCPLPTNTDQPAPGPETAALDTRIALANSVKAGVLVGEKTGVAPGLAYVSEEEMAALNLAIAEAKKVRSNSSATQKEVNDAAADLSFAVQRFHGSIKTDGEKISGFTPEELTALIDTAKEAKQDVVISVDGTDTSPSVYWVTQAAMDAFDDAIAAAEEGAGGTDALYTVLGDAITAFRAALQPGIRAKTVTITGLSAVYNDGVTIRVSLFDENEAGGSPAITGSGTVTGGSVTVDLFGPDGAWSGNGSYYIAFMIEETIIFISEEKAAFNSETIAMAYDDFEPLVSPQRLGDLGTIPSPTTLDAFIQAMTASMPGGPYTYEAWKAPMKELAQAALAGYGYANLDFLDYTFYKDAACTQPFSGTDTVTADTVIYCRAPLEIGGRPETVGNIAGTISFTEYTGQQVSIGSDYYSGNNYSGPVDGRSSSYPVNADGSFSIPFVEDFLTELQSGPQSLHFYLVIGSGGNSYSKQVEDVVIVTAGQLSGEGNLNVGPLGPVSLASVTLSGTITVTLNGQPVPRVVIVVYSQQGGSSGYVNLNTPGANAPWSMTLPVFESPTDLFLGVFGHDANGNQIFSRLQVETVTGITNTDRTGVAINLGAIDTITLSGTIDVTINGQKPYAVEIRAYTDPVSPYGSQIGSLDIENYNTKPNTWSITAEAPRQGNTVYFQIDIMATNNGSWSGYKTLPVSVAVPAPGGQESNIALAYHGSDLPPPMGLMVTGITANSISLSWDSVDGASSYRVYRGDSAYGSYSLLDSVSSGTTYTDSGLAADATYYYTVAAVTSSGFEGPQSYNVDGTTMDVPPASSTPLTLDQWTDGTLAAGQTQWYTFTATGGTYYVSWDDSYDGSNNKTCDIEVSAYTSSGISIFENIDSAYTNPRTISGQSGTIYLKVQGYGDYSSGTYAIKYSQTIDLIAPTGLTVTSSAENSISLSWDSVDGASSYRVYRSDSAYGSYSLLDSVSSGTTYTDSGLAAGTTYYYKVAAVASDWTEGAQSAFVSGITTSGGGPAPGGDTLTVSGHSGSFIVYVVTDTITSSNYATVIGGSSVIASGSTTSSSSVADLFWDTGYGSGTYNVFILSIDGSDSKFKNSVLFTNGSGSVNWSGMTEIGIVIPEGEGVLTFTGGSPGEGWSIIIAPGPITAQVGALAAISAYVAGASYVFPSGSGWMIYTNEAPGGSFDKNGTYAILYTDGSGVMKYQNGVSFSNGNVTINLSSLSYLSSLP